MKKVSFNDLVCSFVLTAVLFAGMISTPVFAALSCSVTTAAACTGTAILRMSGSSNAHAELPSQANSAYDNNVVCCSGVAGLSNSCTGATTVLKLSGTTNAHVEENTGSTFANNACISASGFSFSVGYQSTNCTGFDTTLASISNGAGNAHVGDTTAYTTKVCASATAQSLTFTVANQGFANTQTNITPGTPAMATTTLSVTTSNTSGWNVTLSGDNKNSTNNNLQKTGETTTQITDQTEWIPNAATTSPGTGASRISSLVNSGNVLAFRVMTASSTNGVPFTASSWWGSADSYATDNANTLYAGISSSTVSRMIGNAGTGSVSGSAHLNDVQYYLMTSVGQKTGAYTATLTYTATANP